MDSRDRIPLDPDYNSASDEDFDPDVDHNLSSASSEDESGAPPSAKTTKHKRKAAPEVLPAKLDSGDEATIQNEVKRRAKRRKTSARDRGYDLSDQEDGDGGLVKTRAQRRNEEKERRPLAVTRGTSVDVNTIWAELLSQPVGRPPTPDKQNDDTSRVDGTGAANQAGLGAVGALPDPDEEMITIKRAYKFAGEVVMEERQVPKSSEEAKLFLASQGDTKTKSPTSKSPESEATSNNDTGAEEPQKPPLRRPLRRPFRFEPNHPGVVKGLPPEHQRLGSWWRNGAATNAVSGEQLSKVTNKGKGPFRAIPHEKTHKLNTVEKSRYDWAGYVDKEGIAEELDDYGKAKEGYLGRMEFLERVEHRRDEERKGVKAKSA